MERQFIIHKCSGHGVNVATIIINEKSKVFHDMFFNVLCTYVFKILKF